MKVTFEFGQEEEQEARDFMNAREENDALYCFLYNLESTLRNASKHGTTMPWDSSDSISYEVYTWFLKMKQEAGVDER